MEGFRCVCRSESFFHEILLLIQVFILTKLPETVRRVSLLYIVLRFAAERRAQHQWKNDCYCEWMHGRVHKLRRGSAIPIPACWPLQHLRKNAATQATCPSKAIIRSGLASTLAVAVACRVCCSPCAVGANTI